MRLFALPWQRIGALAVLFVLLVGLTIIGGRGLLSRTRPAADCVALSDELAAYADWYTLRRPTASVPLVLQADPAAREGFFAERPELDAYRRWWQERNNTVTLPSPDDLQDDRWLAPYLDQHSC